MSLGNELLNEVLTFGSIASLAQLVLIIGVERVCRVEKAKHGIVLFILADALLELWPLVPKQLGNLVHFF